MQELKFSLSDIEYRKIADFERSCVEENDDRGGITGGRFSYHITPTSLGNVIVVKDSVTNRDENVTDFDSW